MIYDDLCYSHEADIFANQQKYVKSLNPHEVFVANVEAGNDDQLTIKRLVETYGLTITTKKAPNTICAVGALESIFTKYGYHVLNRVLRLIVGSWEGDPNSFSANMLNAVAKLVVTYREHLDEDIFKDKVGGQSVKQLGRVAKERRSGSMGYGEAMILAFNPSLIINTGVAGSLSKNLKIGAAYDKETAKFKLHAVGGFVVMAQGVGGLHQRTAQKGAPGHIGRAGQLGGGGFGVQLAAAVHNQGGGAAVKQMGVGTDV